MIPKFVEIQTRLRQDWQQHCDQTGLSKPKQATFATDALLLPFTAEAVRACVLVDAGTPQARYCDFTFTEPVNYITFFNLLSDAETYDQTHSHFREDGSTRIVGRDLAEKMRVLVASAIRAGVSAQLASIRPWMWYSHHFSPGCIVDPYADFLDSATRSVTSWEVFCNELLDGRLLRPQGQADAMIAERTRMDLDEIFQISRKLGIIG